MTRTWFITGAAAGFGRLWTEAALERGDNVAATARHPERLRDLQQRHDERLLTLDLDVTNREQAFATVRETAKHFGSLDVVVNNAGYGQFGMLEELTEDELRASLETNLFGAAWITQAALPIMRAQGSGHLLQVSSEGGVIAYPGLGAYHAAKWALEGLTQSLVQEVAGFGIHVTLVEPGPFGTGWAAAGRRSETNPAYDAVRTAAHGSWGAVGDPAAVRNVLLALVDAPDPPLRLLLGSAPLRRVIVEYESRLATWCAWEPVARAA